MLQEARLFRSVLSLYYTKRQTITLDIATSTYYTDTSRSKTVPLRTPLFGIKRQTVTLDINTSIYYTEASRIKTVLMYTILTINILDKNAIVEKISIRVTNSQNDTNSTKPPQLSIEILYCKAKKRAQVLPCAF